MKKILLAGSALAALAFVSPASAAEGVKLNVGGNMDVYAVHVSQKDGAGEPGVNKRSYDLKRDANINFAGETKLDNGLTVGAKIEMKGMNTGDTTAKSYATGTGDVAVQKSFLYMSGDWGKTILGSENGASYLMQVAAPSVDANFDGMDPNFVLFDVGGNNANNSYAMAYGSNSDKITYMTPVYNGFQAGVSYSPTITTRGDGANNAFFGMSTKNNEDRVNKVLEAAVKYNGDFSGVSLEAGAGYSRASIEQDLNAAVDSSSPAMYNVGANVGFSGWKVGAAYTHNNNKQAGANNTDKSYVFGVSYEMGAYNLGASYFHNTQEDGAATKDKLKRIVAGATYTYGPGLTFKGSVHHYNYSDGGNAVANENKGWAIVLGTGVNF